MPYQTLATRTKTGTADDASPISSAPAASDVADVPTFRRASNERAQGWTYYLAFYDAAGAEVLDGVADVTPWVRDEEDASWIECEADESVGHRELMQVDPIFGGASVFFQLTGIEGTSVASVRVRAGSF